MVVEVTVAAAMVVVDFMAAEAASTVAGFMAAGFMAAVPPTLAVVFIAAAAFIPFVRPQEPERGSAAVQPHAIPNSVLPRARHAPRRG
ncbi:hypothetical protein [Bradyrhizobium sp. USDA 4451]